MICPHCKVTSLSVVNGNYYCSRCKLYIGSVKSGFVKAHAVSNKVISDVPIKDNLPVVNLPQNKKEGPKVSVIKRAFRIIVPVLFLGLVLEVWFILATGNSYVDIANFCKIDITDSRNGNEFKLVMNSINMLKKNDPESYKNLCKYIDQIGVKGCDHQMDSCYLRGSKSMYINEALANDKEGAIDRAIQIRKYAEMSRKFWSTK